MKIKGYEITLTVAFAEEEYEVEIEYSPAEPSVGCFEKIEIVAAHYKGEDVPLLAALLNERETRQFILGKIDEQLEALREQAEIERGVA